MRSISSDSDEARAAAELRAALAPVWRARAGRARARMQAVRAAARVATPALARAEEARALSRWWSAQVRAAEQVEESLDLHPLDLPLSVVQLAALPPPDPSVDPVVDSSVDPTLPVEGEGPGVMEGPVFREGLMLGGLKSWMYEDEAMVADGATTETGTETDTGTETGVEKDPAETLQTRYGAGAWQLQDAVALGVSVARQFGTRDLLWDHLVSWDDPLRRTPVPADEDELTTLILDGPRPDLATNVERFADLLGNAWRQGLRLRFTFLTLGGGSERTLDSADEKGGEESDGTVYLSEDLGFDDLLSGSGSALHPNPPRMRSVLRQYWSRDHFDPTFLALAEENPTARRNLRYHLCSLDLSVSFKRVAVRAMARACANLLLQAEAAVKAGQPLSPDGSPLSESDRAAFSLAGVLEGIELFNEADVRCVATPESGADDVVETARIWALGWVSAALGFLDGFAAAGVELPERCLFLPGLASVAASVPVGTSPKAPALTWSPLCWPWKRVFLQTLAEHIDRVWSLLRGEGGLGGGIPTPVLDLPPLDDVVGGVDLHWYPFELRAEVAVGTEKAEVGPLHAAWLMTEVAEVVGILEDLGLDGKVTVTESSASGQRGKGYQVAPGRAPGDVTEEEAEAFQAGEVWRRLLAATAGGASVAGWMPWCELSGDYGGNGLRRKPDERDALAQSTTARPAYFAFHRAALLLRGAETVRLRWPETLPARSAMILPRRGDPNAGLSPVLVFELRTPAVDRIGPTDTREMAWAYVLMVDPTAPDTTAHRVELQSATGSLGGVLRLEPWAGDVEAWAQKNPYGEEVIDGDPELEARRKTWLVQYDLVGSIPALLFPFPGATTASAVEVSRGEPPLVFLSPEAIDFSLTPG